MKINSGFFVFLLLLWMSGSTYWYVCKIKHYCDKTELSDTSDNKHSDDVLISIVPDSKTQAGQDTSNRKKLQIIKNQLLEGYVVYDFPKNCGEHNKIEDAFFEFGENLKLYLNENNESKIIIIGHTDNVGTNSANLAFGFKRASFIKSKLIETGIPEECFIIDSKGETQPTETNETPTGRAKNRRVVIKLSVN